MAAGLKFEPPARTEAADGEEATTEEPAEITWHEIRSKILARCKDAAEEHFLGLFERQYSVASPAEALLKIKAFMGVYLVQEFDYAKFCLSLGTVTAKLMEQEEAWKEHVEKRVSMDLVSATTVMMALASTIAQAYSLEADDWKDINGACGKAVRAVPACYKLHRELPGALNDARALRYLPIPTTDAGQDVNPWRSSEGRELFEDAHGTQWDDIEALTRQDSSPSVCFSGRCAIEEVEVSSQLASVYMRLVEIGEPPEGKKAKDIKVGDPVIWELDCRFAPLLQPGFTVEGDWYEMQNEVCFMSSVASVGPGWER